MISALAVETRAAVRRADIQQQVSAAATNDADSVGAVSIDEEMTALVGAQRAYEASARFLTVVDELLGVLIERTGVVGR
jgi:flagellar hook-associated protein 1 FlgK